MHTRLYIGKFCHDKKMDLILGKLYWTCRSAEYQQTKTGCYNNIINNNKQKKKKKKKKPDRRHTCNSSVDIQKRPIKSYSIMSSHMRALSSPPPLPLPPPPLDHRHRHHHHHHHHYLAVRTLKSLWPQDMSKASSTLNCHHEDRE